MNVSCRPGLPGMTSDIGKLANWPAGMPAPEAGGEVDLGDLRVDRPVVGLHRLGELVVLTSALHPGGGCVLTSRKPAGILIWTLVVLALSTSLGTRNARVALAPTGTTLGCRLTCAAALAGRAMAPAPTSAMTLRRMSIPFVDCGAALIAPAPSRSW